MSNLDVGMKCVKYMLFTTNFMFVMIGFLLISIGSTIAGIYGDFDMFLEGHFFSPSSLLVAIGVIIFFVSLFGCIGAVKESTCLVNIYAVFLSLILILEISAAIAAYSMRNNMFTYIEKNMNESITDYPNNPQIMEQWDILQYNFECCGVRQPEDWDFMKNYTQPINVDTIPVKIWEGPKTCCVEKECNNIYSDGCLGRLHYIVSECAYLVGTGAICVAIVQFLGIVFANMLAKSIRRIKTEEEVKRQENRQRLYAQLAMAGKDDKPTPVLYTPTSSDC